MESITIIITVYKRNYLDEQLASLMAQTVRPCQIWIIQNEDNIDITGIVEKYTLLFPAISTFHSQVNLKYFGRFSLAMFAETEYVLILDDDVIPGPKWLEICLAKSDAYDAIICCTGRIVMPGTFRPEEIAEDKFREYFIGDNYNAEENNYCKEDTLVDYGCNSYFFRREWMKYFWHIWPCTFLSGEDIHLSGTLKVQCAVPTIVPRQSDLSESGNMKKYYSQDMLSSWRHSDFIEIREKVFQYLIKTCKWRPILWKEEDCDGDYSVSLIRNINS